MLHLRRNRTFWNEDAYQTGLIRKDTVATRVWFERETRWPCLPACYLCDVSCRFNSIDMKYQVWKLGVVFTDNVSSVVSHTLWLLLGLLVSCRLVPTTPRQRCHFLLFIWPDNAIWPSSACPTHLILYDLTLIWFISCSVVLRFSLIQ